MDVSSAECYAYTRNTVIMVNDNITIFVSQDMIAKIACVGSHTKLCLFVQAVKHWDPLFLMVSLFLVDQKDTWYFKYVWFNALEQPH